MKFSMFSSNNKSTLLTLFLCLVCSWRASVVVHGEGYPLSKQDFVVTLNDDTFEHETQASTGQTTGSWLVWFHRRKDDTTIVGTPPDEDFWAEHHTIVAAVDVSKSELTRTRFQIKKAPALIYIHKGKFYRYPKTDDYPFSWDTIARFVKEDYATVEAEDVPEPRTLLQIAIAFVEQCLDEGRDYFRLLGYAFGFMSAVAIVNQLFFVDRSKVKKKKQ